MLCLYPESQKHLLTGTRFWDLAVIVAPSGLTGRLSGCCPDDLVTQLYKR